MASRSVHAGGRRAETVTGQVESGTASLIRDPDRSDAWLLEVQGTRQSHVDLANPTDLGFDYVRRIGHVIDERWTSADPLDAVHLGGGGLTIPRFIAASRPGSRQRAFEVDTALTDFVRCHLPLEASWRIRVRGIDARQGLESLKGESADLIINDVFARARVPAHLASLDMLSSVVRVLRGDGVYVANIVDAPPLTFSRTQVANAMAAFAHVVLVVPGGVLKGRRHGNLVLVASAASLPVGRLAQLCTADPSPSRVLAGDAIDRFRAGAPTVTDRTAMDSPAVVDR